MKPVHRRCEYRHIVPPGEFRCKYRHPVVLEPGYTVAYLDIETTDLKADCGIVLTWALKYQGGSVIAEAINDYSEAGEKSLLQSLMARLGQHDNLYLVTFYGTWFDIPFLRSRCLVHDIEFPSYGTIGHLDLFYAARSRLQLSSRSLAAAASFLGIQGKQPLDRGVWFRVRLGDLSVLPLILNHNIGDVKVLEQLHQRLEPYIKPTRRSI